MSEPPVIKTEPEDMTDMFCSIWLKLETPDVEDNEAPKTTDDGNKLAAASQPIITTSAYASEETQRKTKKKTYYKPRPKKILPSSNIMYCDHCDYKTTVKYSLSFHMKNHMQPQHCKICDLSFRFGRGLKKHMVEDHNQIVKVETLFLCDQCDYKSPFKNNLNAHKRMHQVNKEFKCGLCDFQTAYRHNFVKHSKTHANPKQFKCPHCPFQSKYEGYVNRHLVQLHKEDLELPNVCKWCAYSNKESWRVRKHQKQSKLGKEIVCQLCDFKSFYRCEAKLHRQSHSHGDFIMDKFLKERKSCIPNSKKDNINISASESTKANNKNEIADDNKNIELKHKCERCNYITTDKSKLNAHVKKSLQDNVVTCFHCQFETLYACESKLHKKTMHFSEIYGNGRSMDCSNLESEAADMRYTDPGDSSNFHVRSSELAQNVLQPSSSEQAQNLEYNEMTYGKSLQSANNYLIDESCVNWKTIQVLKSNDSIRPFQCNFCEYKSKFKASVQRHFQRHHTSLNNRPYQCVNCSFSSKTKEQIHLHNKRSESCQPIKCQKCDFITLYKCAHKEHEKSHFEHKCKLCEYSSRSKSSMTQHFAIHHLGKGIKCQFCDFTAARKESVLCHETIHTGDKPHKCQFCSYKSVRRTLLLYHLRNIHSVDKGLMTGKDLHVAESDNTAEDDVQSEEDRVGKVQSDQNTMGEGQSEQNVIVETQSEENRSVEVQCDQIRSVEVQFDQNRSVEAQCDQNRIGEVHCDQNRSVEVQCDQNRIGEVQCDMNGFI